MINIKTESEIAIMAEGGRILAKIMERLKNEVRPGITTKDLDRLAESLILSSSAKATEDKKFGCSFKGYKGFPACLCTSVNEEIVHGIPSNRVLKEGDIISLDLGFFYKGFHTDMATTLAVGKISPKAQKLIEVTKNALQTGIKKAKIGNTIGDISNAIQEYVESQGFSVVRELCGHGIGRELHEDPQILNYGEKGTGPKIKEGMTFCLEPMVTIGDGHIKKTNRVFVTRDDSLSSHFEHTIAVTKQGPKILTKL